MLPGLTAPVPVPANGLTNEAGSLTSIVVAVEAAPDFGAFPPQAVIEIPAMTVERMIAQALLVGLLIVTLRIMKKKYEGATPPPRVQR
jgi:hypothetical protein